MQVLALNYILFSHQCYYLQNFVATKWRDSANGQHVEYDQRPDVFRWVFGMNEELVIIDLN